MREEITHSRSREPEISMGEVKKKKKKLPFNAPQLKKNLRTMSSIIEDAEANEIVNALNAEK